MRIVRYLTCLLIPLIVPLGAADIIVDYTVDAGGNNSEPLNGLSARATFHVEGVYLSVLLENTSTGVPDGFTAADSLLVSLGLTLPDVDILSGDAALIGPGSLGLGAWDDRSAGDSVAEEWLWTNEYGGDLLSAYQHIISTSSGQGGGSTTRFDGGSGTVDGPYGGMTASPPIISTPHSKPAVSDSIRFELTLTGPLSEAELLPAARNSIVEFGSDARYLVPEPTAALSLLILVPFTIRRRG